MKKVDYIIVGKGLAGTIIAHMLLLKGKSIIIIDNPKLSGASKVAAGLYNPVVFKRLVKSWMVDELLPFMDEYYEDSEKLLGERFYYKREIIKLFTEENEKEFWLKKSSVSGSEDVGRYLSNEIKNDFLINQIQAPLGSSETKCAGNLDVNKFIELFEIYFIKKNCLIHDAFNFNELKVSDENVNYKNFNADKIIFCEGYKAVDNPYFKWLPFKLTKGEVLTIKIPAFADIDKVINKGVFILPIGDNLFKVGATYEWQDLTEEITEKGKSELLEKIKKVLKVPFEIINHEAGVRPTVKDRRPLLGTHPDRKNVVIFNGLGTKGVMLAPYFAHHLIEYIEANSELNDEVNILRFWNKLV